MKSFMSQNRVSKDLKSVFLKETENNQMHMLVQLSFCI